jgi:protein ImuA
MDVMQHMVLNAFTTSGSSVSGPPRANALPAGVWRASQQPAPPARLCHTAHDELERWLPGRGWPLGSLIEVLSHARGSGELALAAPALANLPSQKPIVLLNPPGMPNALAWQQWHVASERLWWIHPKNPTDAWWSAETVLRSRAFGALLAWVDPIDEQALRRLHASVQDTDTLAFLFRPLSCAAQFSPCPLRLSVHPGAAGLSVQILKSKGTKPAQPLTLSTQPGSDCLAKTSHVDSHRTAALAP